MLKVVDLLRLPSLNQSYVVAGGEGIFNMIRSFEIMEEPYPHVEKYLIANMFGITTLWSLSDNKKDRINLIKAMIDHHCAGIGIMPGVHLNNIIDDEIIALANEHSFPVIYIASSVRYGDLIAEYSIAANGDVLSGASVPLDEVLEVFTDYHEHGSTAMFCQKLGSLLELPLIFISDEVYSANTDNLNVSLAVSRIQEVAQTGVESIHSPMMVRIDKVHMAVVYFGAHSMVACCVSNDSLRNSFLQMYYRIAPSVTRELDKSVSRSLTTRQGVFPRNLEKNRMYMVLMRGLDFSLIEGHTGKDWYLYEINTFLNYCILLVPDCFGKQENVYKTYQNILTAIKPELFIFAQISMDKKELTQELTQLKYMVHSLSFLSGVYSLDEQPLIYILTHAPQEYGSHLFPMVKKMTGIKAEDAAFLDTLRLYLVIHNIADVAALLGIHANSVKYRLTKALQYLGCGEDKPLGDMPLLKLLTTLEFLVAENK